MTLFQILQAFLHFLYWASHFQWVAWGPDPVGNGNHIIYGGNVLDCIQVSQHTLANVPGAGHAAICTMAP
jgi:hypothetical protein